MNIFDSHAHYDDKKFKGDLDETIKMIQQNGVSNVINVGCDIKSSIASIALAKKYDMFFASVGIHPHEAANVPPDYIDQLRLLLAKPKVVALGEIGLDYHYDFSPRTEQKAVFERQLKLAIELNKPVIIHAREATSDTMSLLEKYKPAGVVHCFSSSAQTAELMLRLGMYIGITGVVTFPNARKIREVILITPLDRLLLETDCPYMAPVPYRGQRTTSDMIIKTAQAIADIKGVDVNRVISSARENTIKLFSCGSTAV